jgi:hypothetical protein
MFVKTLSSFCRTFATERHKAGKSYPCAHPFRSVVKSFARAASPRAAPDAAERRVIFVGLGGAPLLSASTLEVIASPSRMILYHHKCSPSHTRSSKRDTKKFPTLEAFCALQLTTALPAQSGQAVAHFFATINKDGGAMAIGIYFPPSAMTAETYDECIKLLKKAGSGNPPGRSYHAAFGPKDDIRVFDVWTSQAAFDRFAKKLMPILQQLGVPASQPTVLPMHKVIMPAKAPAPKPKKQAKAPMAPKKQAKAAPRKKR